jgi:hypothetical protein
MTSRPSQIIVRWVLLLGLVASVPVLLAQDKKSNKPQSKPQVGVRVQVVVILASEKSTEIAKKCECVAREVQKMNPKLTGFRMDKVSTLSMPIGSAYDFELIENQKTNITIENAAEKMERVRLKVGPPQMGEITYSTPCGKFLPIITPYRTKKDEVVILAIRVQQCTGK